MNMTDKIKISRRNFLLGSGAITAATLVTAPETLAKNLAPSPVADNLTHQQEEVLSKNYRYHFSGKLPDQIPEGYNILLITSVQERYFDPYPFPVPGRERLMASGTTFTNHHICSSVCTPSRSVLYTGLHMPETKMFDNPGFPWMPDSLDPELGTIGNIMSDMGYYPAYKGKWHLSTLMEDPVTKNTDGSTDLGMIPRIKLHEIMEGYGFHDYTGIGDIIGHSHGGYLYDELTAAEAINWLRDKGSEMQSNNKPWFLAVNLVNPHDTMYIDTDSDTDKNQWHGALILNSNSSTPNKAPQNTIYLDSWPEVPLAPSRHQAFSEHGRPPAHLEYQLCNGLMVGNIADQDRRWRILQDYYFNCIRDNDTHLVRILDELDALNLTKNTIIVYTADHGELCGAHQMNGKGTCTYKEQVHVPMIISHPAFPGGRKCSSLTSHVDIAPTLVGLTGKANKAKSLTLKNRKGYDFSTLLFNPESSPIDAIRKGILYCYDMLLFSDATYIGNMFKIIRNETLSKEEKQQRFSVLSPDLRKRGGVRMIFDGRYKFTRYFSLQQHHTPQTPDALFSLNDIELYDLKTDPHEMNNLANNHQNVSLILSMNEKLNALFSNEITGKDDGSWIPPLHGIRWDLDPERVRRLIRD
ncbi:TPA: sulfatase-like hydrolase/transferase [Klebsiella variicola subsp. variicola]|uniref:sulfatase-like hydrolase/transferase n=1 Tax=Klebsiella TaxID=570 RepID=UPI0016615D8C|nr:sulfatase-like hydrolase/transferase [Klebsiella variicola]MBD0718373.1 sulfatase-like hydrolase/transferase [Klebsiella variicola]HED1710075.1 sulfatase-like hydrolase/transferase [Klebsiella variicola subsp. variicola]